MFSHPQSMLLVSEMGRFLGTRSWNLVWKSKC